MILSDRHPGAHQRPVRQTGSFIDSDEQHLAQSNGTSPLRICSAGLGAHYISGLSNPRKLPTALQKCDPWTKKANLPGQPAVLDFTHYVAEDWEVTSLLPPS